MSIVSAHLSRASSALLHLSSISHSLHDDDQITFFSIRASSWPTRVLHFFSLLFVRSYARSLALMVGTRKKKYSSTTVRYTYAHITHSVTKYGEKAVFFFFSFFSFPFLQCTLWVDVMLQGSKSSRHDA